MPQAAQNAREGEEDNGDIPPAFNRDLTSEGGWKTSQTGHGLHRPEQICQEAHTPVPVNEAIPPEAKLFCKLDAVHGYFQLALDNCKLTTFLIQRDASATSGPRWDSTRPQTNGADNQTSSPRAYLTH